MISLTCEIKPMNLFTKEKQAHRLKKQTWLPKEKEEEG